MWIIVKKIEFNILSDLCDCKSVDKESEKWVSSWYI
jgi:hypothetical protein